MIGAPALTAAAAIRAGAGLVRIAAPDDLLRHILTIEPCATGIAWTHSDQDPLAQTDIHSQLHAVDPDDLAVLAVGPGLGRSTATARTVMQLLAGQPPTTPRSPTRPSRRLLLDADGLNALADSAARRPLGRSAPARDRLILTPHPGEFARLAKPLGITHSPTDPRTRPDAAGALARAHRAVVLLKGRHTVVTDGRRTHLNTTGNPALATPGSGDVLTGLIAALWAQGLSAYDAARLGAHLHGRAADLWANHYGTVGLNARTLADLLPAALADHRAASALTTDRRPHGRR